MGYFGLDPLFCSATSFVTGNIWFILAVIPHLRAYMMARETKEQAEKKDVLDRVMDVMFYTMLIIFAVTSYSSAFRMLVVAITESIKSSI
jgi:membrane protein insertase Oxa1/YidC/SpoIIIJ